MRMQLKYLVGFLEVVGGRQTAVMEEGGFGNNVR